MDWDSAVAEEAGQWWRLSVEEVVAHHACLVGDRIVAVVHHLTDRVLVFKDGQVAERGDVEEVFTAPDHPYTRDLLASLPGRWLRKAS
ncbi:hypothetical protein [Streptomyces sp. 3N207]|uniref:hypothetical protein n=1 Tax=Streptomyces sp. 3N207 TaxID=3457417 RepID=UPI003FD00FDD